MRRARAGARVVVLGVVLALLPAACGGGDGDSRQARCEAEVEAAAKVPQNQRTPGELFPAIVACDTLRSFSEAARKHPDALGGVDVLEAVRRACTDPGDPRVHETEMCANI